MTSKSVAKPELYSVYPVTSLLIYNGVTVLHYLAGGLGLVLGYGALVGGLLGAAYLFFAFGQMYIWMPLKVCPNCVYYHLEGSRCISGLNLVARKMAGPGVVKNFASRAEGLLCPNNLYLASFILPLVLILPALVLSFGLLLLGIWLTLVGLLLVRMFVIFRKVACAHCRAKNICPNAQAMGLG